eukprot:CAMPEP_0178462300 /NCGR_PEP_ID=MMETSP0689_2-20121128/49754_1 /TAXON_ID=160604 /ORGANISM="Amphidinium massartii, Strain CS-259" /LENGTH=669 /DNA_ID=CAMNT_0020089163 /DNA_START=92 /DNA_END=2100 /DNA_ORIENTATION=+
MRHVSVVCCEMSSAQSEFNQALEASALRAELVEIRAGAAEVIEDHRELRGRMASETTECVRLREQLKVFEAAGSGEGAASIQASELQQMAARDAERLAQAQAEVSQLKTELLTTRQQAAKRLAELRSTAAEAAVSGGMIFNGSIATTVASPPLPPKGRTYTQDDIDRVHAQLREVENISSELHADLHEARDECSELPKLRAALMHEEAVAEELRRRCREARADATEAAAIAWQTQTGSFELPPQMFAELSEAWSKSGGSGPMMSSPLTLTAALHYERLHVSELKQQLSEVEEAALETAKAAEIAMVSDEGRFMEAENSARKHRMLLAAAENAATLHSQKGAEAQKQLAVAYKDKTSAQSQVQAKAAEIHALKAEVQNQRDLTVHELTSCKHAFDLEMHEMEQSVREAKDLACRESNLAEHYREVQSTIVEMESEACASASHASEAQTIELHNLRMALQQEVQIANQEQKLADALRTQLEQQRLLDERLEAERQDAAVAGYPFIGTKVPQAAELGLTASRLPLPASTPRKFSGDAAPASLAVEAASEAERLRREAEDLKRAVQGWRAQRQQVLSAAGVASSLPGQSGLSPRLHVGTNSSSVRDAHLQAIRDASAAVDQQLSASQSFRDSKLDLPSQLNGPPPPLPPPPCGTAMVDEQQRQQQQQQQQQQQ